MVVSDCYTPANKLYLFGEILVGWGQSKKVLNLAAAVVSDCYTPANKLYPCGEILQG